MDNTQKIKQSFERVKKAYEKAFGKNFGKLALTNILGDLDENGKQFEKRAIFGFNIRLKSDDETTPLMGGTKWNIENKKVEVLSQVLDEIGDKKTIPEIFKGFALNTIKFKFHFDKQENQYKVEGFDDINDSEIINNIQNKGSFANVQQSTFFGNAEQLYFWISRECKNLDNIKEQNDYLSNVLVISEDENDIKYVEKHHVDFLRFLFQMETAYAMVLEEERKVEAIKSAIAALMSRNMSHNLGSHYLTNTKNYFRRRIADSTLQENLSCLKADYRGASHLLQYMQERMDFIATVVSTDRYPLGSLNFKAEFFDVLTNDDCGERHTNNKDPEETKYEKNFLLQYLLYSEKYTRRGHTCDTASDNMDDVRLQVKLVNKLYTKLYTGLNSEKDNDEEKQLKLRLSKLRLAVPGGIMARHALFTLVENILRNSAKHNKRNKNENALILTIEIVERDGHLTLAIHDNSKALEKEKTLLTTIKKKYETIKIVNFEKNNVIDKENKGLKEMLICALWLRNEDVAQRLYDIQKGCKKADEYLRVTEKDGNLCYEIDLDVWNKFHHIKLEKIKKEKFLSIHADYIVAKNDYFVVKNGDDFEITDAEKNTESQRRLSEIFPRFRKINDLNDNQDVVESTLLDKIKAQEDGNYQLLINNPDENVEYQNNLVKNIHKNTSYLNEHKNDNNIIVFYDHYLNGGIKAACKKIDLVPNALYVDSISGENFTFTLVSPDFLEDNILRMKVVESAITKIVVLDERVWEDYSSKWKDLPKETFGIDENYNIVWELVKDKEDGGLLNDEWNELRNNNVDAYNWAIGVCEQNTDGSSDVKVLKKQFNDLEPVNRDNLLQKLMEKKNIFIYTMPDDYLDRGNESFLNLSNSSSLAPDFKCKFLTVHLGLIEKYLEHNKDKKPSNFIELIKKCFKPDFVAIHSGRGNFSPELENDLKSYPFISLSAVEAALGNSKYLLSELFYNTNYYGKGEIND